MLIKTLSISFFFVLVLSVRLFAQDIKDIAEKMRFSSHSQTPRFNMTLPDSVKGISIVYDELKYVTAQKLQQLNKIELVELQFKNQIELDEEVKLLANFPAMKYLVLNGWGVDVKLATPQIKLPEILASYRNIVGLKFYGKWKIDYPAELLLLKKLPNLHYLYFQGIEHPIPDVYKGLTQLKGISVESSNLVVFPEWITSLPNLESISLSLSNYRSKEPHYLNYVDVLTKLQKLPLLKSLYLLDIRKNEGDFDKLRFDNLRKIELDHADFNSNKSFLGFLANQTKLRSIRIKSSSPVVLNANFSKLKELRELSITGYDGLYINFNLAELTKLKSLRLSGLKQLMNHSAFPKDLDSLELYATGMKVLPNAILKLRKLKSLSIQSDSLSSLPDDFSNLKQLEYLNLASNRLNKLPENFGALRNLKTLHLSSNPIIELPESLGELTNLKILKLEGGALKRLPANIGRLKKLQILNVRGNFITHVPESLVNIKTLETLDLSYNLLVGLPHGIGNMRALENLMLEHNNIQRLPISIGELQHLKRIELNFNDLDSLPEQISNLKSLQILNLNAGTLRGLKFEEVLRALENNTLSPTRKKTVNHIKNFPEDLSKWTSLKELYLDNNTKINTEQLFKGLFTIPSKGYVLSLENCGLSYLPNSGWEKFLPQTLYLQRNQIKEIPAGIVHAPYLTRINSRENKLKTSPYSLNQYVANEYEKALWFVDLGIISDQKLPKTDDMVLALVKKSQSHYYRKEFKKAVELSNTAVSINDSLAMNKMSLTDMGQANYEVGNYTTAIKYLSKAILRDTADGIRIMNFVIPDFDFRAKSYLKLGDTLSAIRDYKILAEKFSDSWGDVGLLYKATHQSNEANIALEKGIEKFHDQITYLTKTKQSAALQQLSLLELLIIKEDFKRAILYADTLEKEFKLIEHVTLLRYLKSTAEIGNQSFVLKGKPELLSFIKLNKASISNWDYGLFVKWLTLTKLPQDNKTLISELTDLMKN